MSASAITIYRSSFQSPFPVPPLPSHSFGDCILMESSLSTPSVGVGQGTFSTPAPAPLTLLFSPHSTAAPLPGVANSGTLVVNAYLSLELSGLVGRPSSAKRRASEYALLESYYTYRHPVWPIITRVGYDEVDQRILCVHRHSPSRGGHRNRAAWYVLAWEHEGIHYDISAYTTRGRGSASGNHVAYELMSPRLRSRPTY